MESYTYQTGKFNPFKKIGMIAVLMVISGITMLLSTIFTWNAAVFILGHIINSTGMIIGIITLIKSIRKRRHFNHFYPVEDPIWGKSHYNRAINQTMGFKENKRMEPVFRRRKNDNYKICSVCGTQAEISQIYCRACGNDLKK